MIIGTTPTHYFDVDFDTSAIKKIEIVYAQDNEILVTKTEEDCEINGKRISWELTQEETLKFDHEKRVEVQFAALTTNKKTLRSYVKRIPAYKCLSKKVLV